MLHQNTAPETLDSQVTDEDCRVLCFEYLAFGVVLWLLELDPLGMPRKLSCRDPTVIAYTAFPGELSVFCGPKLIKPHDIHGRQISINHDK